GHGRGAERAEGTQELAAAVPRRDPGYGRGAEGAEATQEIAVAGHRRHRDHGRGLDASEGLASTPHLIARERSDNRRRPGALERFDRSRSPDPKGQQGPRSGSPGSSERASQGEDRPAGRQDRSAQTLSPAGGAGVDEARGLAGGHRIPAKAPQA